MKIGMINQLGFGNELSNIQNKQNVNETGFGNLLKGFVSEVNNQQLEVGKATEDYIQGKNDVELHEVMIAAEKAKTSLQLLTEIRNKSIDMYKELIRMQ